MFSVIIHRKDTSPVAHQFELDAWLGSGRDCEIRVGGLFIGKRHARLFQTPSGVIIESSTTLAGVTVNGTRTHHYGPLAPQDRVVVGNTTLSVENHLEPRHGVASKETVKVRPPEPVAAQEMPAPMQKGLAEKAAQSQAEVRLRRQIHEELLKTLDLRRRDVSKMSDDDLRLETATMVADIVRALHAEIPVGMDREALCLNAVNEAVGLGPLEDLLNDESVTEIMVNRHDEVYVERKGRLHLHPVAFTSDKTVLGVIERIVAPLGRRIDESSPMVDARLKDGSRVNAIIPPLAIKGPTVTIRKFSKHRLSADDLVGFGAISEHMAEFLRICVRARKNIIVSGGTGSGKTTLLNILSNYIPEGERIITIEDAAELRIHHQHLVSLEARPANVEGRGLVSIRDLVKNALRMRPDRIVVGECRGAEALDMLQAMNTGHEGSLTTLHANTPRDALARLETLVLMAGMDLPLAAIREQVVSAVDILVQQTRFSCGARKVTRIVEVTGIESGKIQLQELFRFDRSSVDSEGRTVGRFVGCDTVPSFYEAMSQEGTVMDLGLFKGQA